MDDDYREYYIFCKHRFVQHEVRCSRHQLSAVSFHDERTKNINSSHFCSLPGEARTMMYLLCTRQLLVGLLCETLVRGNTDSFFVDGDLPLERVSHSHNETGQKDRADSSERSSAYCGKIYAIVSGQSEQRCAGCEDANHCPKS